MMADPGFVQSVEAGWEDVEAGRVVPLKQSHTIVGVLAHSCNLYRK